VERAKIEVSMHAGRAAIDLDLVERGLQASVDAAGMAAGLAPLLEQVVDCAEECLQRAGVAPQRLDAVYLTGGSSALQPFQEALQRRFPATAIVEGDLFGGVGSGLAYAALR
jgi:hypothetical chaperone protein